MKIITPTAKLRKKKLNTDKISLYLDFYPPVKYPNGRESRREFLNLYLIVNPQNSVDLKRNDTTLKLANAICSRRNLELLNKSHGLIDPLSSKGDFLAYFKKFVDQTYSDSKGNFQNYKSSFEHFSNFCNRKCQFGEITSDRCADFLQYLLTKAYSLKYKTKNVHLNVNSCISYFNKFSLCIKKAMKDKYLEKDLLDDLDLPKEETANRSFLMPDEVKLLLSTKAPNEIIKRATVFAIFTGLRFSDIRDMTWAGLHQNTTVKDSLLSFVQNKTQMVVNNPLPSNEVFKLAVGEMGEPSDRLFPDLSYSRVCKELPLWVESAGIQKRITFHCLRHTYAVLLIYYGVDIYTVSKLMGHSNVATTLIYAKLLDETKIKAVEKFQVGMDELLRLDRF